VPGTSGMRRAWTAVVCLGVGACSQAPVLNIPAVPVAGTYKEAGSWVPAQPADALPRDAWWMLYGDAELNDLERQLIAGSPDLAAALARYQQARAAYEEIRASLFPSLSTAFNVQRDRQSESKPLRVLGPNSPNEYSSATLGFGLGYEFDLWGKVSDRVASGRALDQAAKADLESARLSLQAQLADSYLTLRGLDRQVGLLRDTEAAYARELELIKKRHDGGIASGLDVSRAQSQVETTRSQLNQALASRALVEHAIASLIGVPAPDFAIEPRLTVINLPEVPVGVPSTLLQRRPDIAAAERRVVAANASVGVAKSAFFPSLRLDALYGYQGSELANLITAPNVFWAVGPTLFLDLFDGGRKTAEVARTQAVLDEAGANYRSVVLVAFQQVEDNLALLENYRAAAEAEAAAVAATQRSVDLSTTRYRQGAASYLEVTVSQTGSLLTRREAEDLATRQLRASVQLIRALGGGWTAESNSSAPHP
jgi:NodT family efflux transporter outer membrane factor (OMF) lipoprotein